MNQKKIKKKNRILLILRTRSLPPEDLTVQAAGSELCNHGGIALVWLDISDAVLVLSGNITSKLSSIASTLGGLILEHLHGSLSGAGVLGSSSSLLLIKALHDLPGLRASESDKVRSTVETSDNELALIEEHAVHHGEELHLCNCEGRLRTIVALSDRDSAVVANEGKPVARGAESDALDPTVAVELTDGLVKWLLGAPRGGDLPAVDFLDGAVEDASLEVSRSSSKELVVGVPCDAGDGAAVLLNVLADPPIVVLLEVADRDDLCAAGDSELVTLRAPLNVGGSAVDTQDNQHGLPLLLSSIEGPHVSVTILRARNDTVVDAVPVDASYNTVVLLENELSLPASALLSSDDDIIVVGAERALGAVRVPAMACDALTLGDGLHFPM